MKELDETVGSKPWAARTVCNHLCGEGKRGDYLSDGTPVVLYECPRCGKRDLTLNLVEGTVRCFRRDCFSRNLDYLGFLAEMEGLDFRTQRQAVMIKRNQIIKEARDAHAVSLTESREQQAVDAELGPRESRYTPEQRRAVLEELEHQEEMAEEERRRAARESRRREDEARSEVALARITNAKAAVTWHELAVALAWFFGTLLAVYYGSAALQDFADYSPVPEGLEGLGIPSEGSEPDSWFLSFLRGVVGWLPLAWFVSYRFPIALLLAVAIAGAYWLVKSLQRRRGGALRDGEYVGVYVRDDEGKILWR